MASRSCATADSWAPWVPLEGYRNPFGRGAGGLFDVQRLLAKDSLMQASQGGTGVNAEIVGEHGLQPPVRLECIVLAFRKVVGGYQLCPQRFSVGVIDHQGPQAH